jgi:tetratricopeptide (TPR) repeat protein
MGILFNKNVFLYKITSMIKKFIFYSSFLFFTNINGQKPDKQSIDSLWTVATDKQAYAHKGSKEMLRLCTEIYYQSKNIHYEKGELRALVKMSEIYINEQNYEESLNKISEGLLLAEKNNNNIIWSDLLRLQSNVYSQLGYYEKADKSARKALLIANKIKEDDRKHLANSHALRKIAENKLQENILEKKYDSVHFYFYKAYTESKKLSSNFPYRNLRIAKNAKNMALILFYEDKIPEAEKYLHWYEELTKNIKENPEYTSFYTLKGNIENRKGNYLKAVEYFNKSIHFSKEYRILPLELAESYSGIAESYKELHDYKNQSVYIEKAKKITDSLSAAEKSLVEKVARSEKTDESKEKYPKLLVLGIMLALVIAGITFFLLKRKKIFSRENAFNEKENGTEYTQAINPVEKQTTITDSQELNNVIELAKANSSSFSLKFSEVFPTFNQKLLEINPQLTPSDLEYCALMKLNFDTKQIATFKKSSIGSVETRKSRIRKKLNIINSENIYTWLMKIQ